MSSANGKWDTLASLGPTRKLLNILIDSTLVMTWLRESSSKVKTEGDGGSLCLRSSEDEKKPSGCHLEV